MINAIYGKKIGMTQIFDEEDRIVPVTVIQAEPNTVCQLRPSSRRTTAAPAPSPKRTQVLRSDISITRLMTSAPTTRA